MTVKVQSVSVVVVNWNQKLLTSRCLASLERQSVQHLEVILVDNGSNDGSIQYLSELFPNIKVISLEQNLGFAGGANQGIKHASGELIALLNNDAEATPAWIEQLVEGISSSPEIGFCASKMILLEKRDRLDSAGDYLSPAGTAGKMGHGDRSDLEFFCKPRRVFGACAGAALYRREMLDSIGLFDEDFFISQEDVDLSFRAQLRGYQCLYVPSAIVYHKLSASLKTYSESYVYYGHRNLEYVYLKNMPLSLLILTLPLHLLDVFFSLCLFAFKGKHRSFARAKRDVLRNWNMIIRKRREIQKLRSVPVSAIYHWFDWKWLIYKFKRAWRSG